MSSAMNGPRSAEHSFRPDIEGMRGVAVLLVVLFDCRVPGFQGGFIGVDVLPVTGAPRLETWGNP